MAAAQEVTTFINSSEISAHGFFLIYLYRKLFFPLCYFHLYYFLFFISREIKFEYHVKAVLNLWVVSRIRVALRVEDSFFFILTTN